LHFILFGWLGQLVKAAFSHRIDVCRDCGTSNRYKTTGSWIALAVLILLVLGGLAAFFASETD